MFAKNGQILDDRQLGFCDVASQLDEGAAGTTKDLFDMVVTPLAVSFDQHHGKTIDVGVSPAVINLPSAGAAIKGMKVTVRNKIIMASNPSITINCFDANGSAATLIRGSLALSSGATTLNTDKSSLAFNSCAAYETTVDLEFDGTNWITSGKSVAALV